MLVPGLPITELAVGAVAASGQRSGCAAAAGVRARPESLREVVRTWKARLLFAACYAFVVGVVVMAG
jgi:hypothetical protein